MYILLIPFARFSLSIEKFIGTVLLISLKNVMLVAKRSNNAVVFFMGIQMSFEKVFIKEKNCEEYLENFNSSL